MTPATSAEPADRSPSLVLRPAAAGARAGDGGDGAGGRAARHRLRWELVDPWASPHRAPAGVATTHRVHDVVHLTGVVVAADARADTTRCLVQQLVAALRRTDAAVVCCALGDEAVRRELVAAGFATLPDEQHDTCVDPVTRLILQL